MITPFILEGLLALRDEFAAQLANADPPSSEHAIHFCLALGLQRAFNLAPGSIVFERPVNGGRLDLWVLPLDLAVEIKFHRQPSSGASPPFTQKRGELLADFNKLARGHASHRLVLLVTDQPHLASLEHSEHRLLPLEPGAKTILAPQAMAPLPMTEATHAVADGDWHSCEAELAWRTQCIGWHLLAWLVRPTGSEDTSHNSTMPANQVDQAAKEAAETMPGMPPAPFGAVRQRIIAHAGQTFTTVHGIEFTYEIHGNSVKPKHVNCDIGTGQFEQAFQRLPISGPGQIHDLFGLAYIYAILADPRIVSTS